MYVDADVVGVTLAEPCEEVLADGLDRAEGLVADGRGALRETTIRRRAGKLLADEFLAVARRDAVDGVALDHSYLCAEAFWAPGSGPGSKDRKENDHVAAMNPCEDRRSGYGCVRRVGSQLREQRHLRAYNHSVTRHTSTFWQPALRGQAGTGAADLSPGERIA